VITAAELRAITNLVIERKRAESEAQKRAEAEQREARIRDETKRVAWLLEKNACFAASQGKSEATAACLWDEIDIDALQEHMGDIRVIRCVFLNWMSVQQQGVSASW
jgi:hypothetical protein